MAKRVQSSCLVVLCLLAASGWAADVTSPPDAHESPEPPRISGGSWGPYCGVFCVYTVLRLAGVDLDVRLLLDPKYVGSKKGSSLAELARAAEDHGLHASIISNVGTDVLRRCPYPVILHVKSDLTRDKEYGHYELFLSEDRGKARICDPPDAARSIPFPELAARWDGNGLVISPEPIDTKMVLSSARERLLMLLLGGGALIAGINVVKSRWSRRWRAVSGLTSFRLSLLLGAGFAVVAVLCGVLYHLVRAEGLLANAQATAAIQRAHQGGFIPKISCSRVGRLLGTEAVFVDARLPADFQAGHLEGAINVPVNATEAQRDAVLTGVAKNATVIVYCQSARCEFAKKVAVMLREQGWDDLLIFRGGWNEWVSRNGWVQRERRAKEV